MCVATLPHAASRTEGQLSAATALVGRFTSSATLRVPLGKARRQKPLPYIYRHRRWPMSLYSKWSVRAEAHRWAAQTPGMDEEYRLPRCWAALTRPPQTSPGEYPGAQAMSDLARLRREL